MADDDAAIEPLIKPRQNGLLATDNFGALWRSLTETQRKFLISAYEIDRRLPHAQGMDKVMPPIGWRTVGLLCGMKLVNVDDFVRTLADLRLVLIADAELREMVLICGTSLRLFLDVERERRWNRLLLIAAVLVWLTLCWFVRS